MSEDNTMGISRAPKLEWNLNTVLQIISLLTLLSGGIYVWSFWKQVIAKGL